jgi:transglutaminase-like putative cysteine protease
MIWAILLIFCAALAIANTAFASEDSLKTTINGTNSTSDQPAVNTAFASEDSLKTMNGTNSTSDQHIAEIDTQNNSNNTKSDDSVETSSNDNSIAAGTDNPYNNIHGIWIEAADANQLNIQELINAGITDIFVKSNRFSQPTYDTVLPVILKMVEGTGINVHAWITCFKDANGKWVDPQGLYTYTVKVAYMKWYKGWYKKYYTKWKKKWYKSNGRWKYKWVKVSKYYWKYGWYSRTAYKYVTHTAYNKTFNNNLIKTITDITTKYNIAGIFLDYVRYPGTAYKYSGSTSAITNFVHTVHDTVKLIKPNVAVSAALMPEGSVNAYYYGQDYSQLSQYLDFLVPMVYKGNYGKTTAWIGTTTNYIVSKANGKPVIVGLQTYKSDSNLAKLSASELMQDIKAAAENGASGYVLFRYGLIDPNFSDTSIISPEAAGSSSTVKTTTTTSPTTTSQSLPASFYPYLHSSANCQVTAQICALAASLTKGKTTTYDKAVAIFNYVRDNIGYSFYYNTKYGAQGTLNKKTGNCCDTTHLLIALERAVGIPARYVHGYCQFKSSGNWYGHVWAQVYVNGKWYTADAISLRNNFGVINNWYTSTYKLYGTYASLPF